MKEQQNKLLDDDHERYLQGAPVSEGIAIGTLFFVQPDDEEEVLPEFAISGGQVEDEIKRYRRALSSSREDLKKLQCQLCGEGSKEATEIIASHIEMLKDPLMTSHMEEMIRKMKRNTESVFKNVVDGYREKLSQTQDTFFQQRIIDVIDLSKRILSHLQTKPKTSLADVPPNSIIFAKELAPSDTASAQATRVSAFVTQVGGGSSHAALIARAKGIPFVASIDIQLLKNAHGKDVIVNGLTGDVIINPSEKTLEKHLELQEVLKQESKELQSELHHAAETLDGEKIALFANVGSVPEVTEMHCFGANGVGLFRSEFLLCEDESVFQSHEKQFEVYRAVAAEADGLPVVIRAFDIGGDKFPEIILERESNPGSFVGCRGIRFILRHEEILRTQLKAILCATPYGDLRLLLPLITDMKELMRTKELISELKKELASEGVTVGDLPIGCLIEVPAAVLIAEDLAKECDFFSIGTNDLIQYLLGVDRSEFETSDYYLPAHPSVIKTIKTIVQSATVSKTPVTLCGEIASNPHFIPLLLGLGLRSFSCSPRYIPIIKRIIRQCNLKKSECLADAVLKLHTPEETSQLLRESYRELKPANR